ncbi:hypothetical protein RM780_09775 [Streptomyces sp. DSM 44917]|uniref:Uncharacterized protein n=1 Tax=Streptomyces boetiae TaxID=3075541 RepID=A0ABU2L6Q8_9ACTN|nr:hypothetical protein [Streptomyces sp. DSM 44917]MDT0307250.1 hypothetical protein [Streptomyces sp. DSM 44917]
MGYTHYFGYAPLTEDFGDAWPDMVVDAWLIVDHLTARGIRIAGPDGEGGPIIEPGHIALNGAGDEAHEPLIILPRPPTAAEDPFLAREYTRQRFVRDFCKTSRKPYDVAVAAVLLRCHQRAPGAFAIGSDGGWDQEWRRGAFPASPAGNLSARGVVEDVFGPTPTDSPLLRGDEAVSALLDPPQGQPPAFGGRRP